MLRIPKADYIGLDKTISIWYTIYGGKIMNIKKAIKLLREASEKLQDYRAEVDGDYNDGLAMEINDFLDKIDNEEGKYNG